MQQATQEQNKISFWRRAWRHSWAGQAWLTRQLPGKSLATIEQAIAASESTHSGEIRFAVEAGLDLADIIRGKSAQERTLEVFSQLRIWDTEENNGVLIYLLMADHDVEILADRGLNNRVGTVRWQEICSAMEQQFRAGEFESGVLNGIAAISRELQQHFPPQIGDRNELANAPFVL